MRGRPWAEAHGYPRVSLRDVEWASPACGFGREPDLDLDIEVGRKGIRTFIA
jgi:hypothetical protein